MHHVRWIPTFWAQYFISWSRAQKAASFPWMDVSFFGLALQCKIPEVNFIQWKQKNYSAVMEIQQD